MKLDVLQYLLYVIPIINKEASSNEKRDCRISISGWMPLCPLSLDGNPCWLSGRTGRYHPGTYLIA